MKFDIGWIDLENPLFVAENSCLALQLAVGKIREIFMCLGLGKAGNRMTVRLYAHNDLVLIGDSNGNAANGKDGQCSAQRSQRYDLTQGAIGNTHNEETPLKEIS
jgi:hypothetical protein